MRPLVPAVYHLTHIVTRQSVWSSEQHTINDSAFYSIAESVQAGTIQVGSTIAVVPENVNRQQGFTLQIQMASQSSNCWSIV